MQEEVNRKTIALAISGTKITGRTLAKAISIYLKSRKNKQYKLESGKQTLKELKKHNAKLANIEITEKNIKSFNQTAKKYKIDYALKKDNSEKPPRYYVFFKGNDVDVIEIAMKEYSNRILKQKQKPSIHKAIKKMTEHAKTQNRYIEKNKSKDRGIEL